MKILISGYYGYGNIGDEAVLEAIKLGFAEHQVSVLTSKRWDLLSALKAISTCDLLVSGGGTLIQNSTSQRSYLYYIGVIQLAKLLGKRVMILGQGFGPLTGDFARRVAKLVLNQVDIITLRDEASAEELKKLGVTKPTIKVTGDPTGLLTPDPNPLPFRNLPEHPRVAIVVRKLVKGDDKKFREILDQTIEWLKQTYNFHPVFIEFQPSPYSPRELLALIAQFDLLIGMRLHALIFAALAGVPMLGLSYDPKVAAFMKIIEQPYIDLSGELDLKQIKNTLEEIIMNKTRIREDLLKTQKQLHHAASCNFVPCLPAGRPSCLSGKKGTVDFAGVHVDNVDMSDALQIVKDFWTNSQPNLIVTPNPELIVTCQKDEELRLVINGATLRVPDGISMVVVSRLKRSPLKERVSGIDLMNQIINNYPGKRVFLLGGQPNVAATAAAKLSTRAIIAGTHQGYFKSDSEIVQQIKSSRPDILFVGLGGGRQEKWAAKYLQELNVPIVMCIGGSLDVISGLKKRAPVICQKLYIEWLYRLLTEPTRWKRQLALPKFLYLTLLKKML